jgi:SAM-dependent methyltransferase
MQFVRRLDSVKAERDAFGQELWAAYNSQEVCEIVERDDGYFSSRPSQVYFSENKDWPSIEQKAMEFVRGRVLDIGCGAGRHSLYLQEKGFDVWGIDNSPLAVKVCKLRGLKKVRLMPLEHLDFKPNTFDTVLMLGGNFALLGNPEKAERVLNKLHRTTSRDAVIIGETRDPYKTDNPLHLEYHKQNRKKGKLSGQSMIRVRFEKTVTEWIEYMIVSKEEMKQLVANTGWKVSQFIEDEGTAYIGIITKLHSAHACS